MDYGEAMLTFSQGPKLEEKTPTTKVVKRRPHRGWSTASFHCAIFLKHLTFTN